MDRLERHGSGYVGRHEPDVFISGDPWFRGLEISTGPDGSGYILDWSDIGECHESTGVHRTSGRIFKITHGAPQRVGLDDLATFTTEGAERLLRNPNVWFERQCRERIADGEKPAGLTAMLTRLLDEKSDPVVRLRALWSLNLAGGLTRERLQALLREKDEHLRVWAIRLLADRWPMDAITGPMPGATHVTDDALLREFETLAGNDPSGLVRLTLASTLQRLPVPRRAAIAATLVARKEDADDAHLPPLVWYGLIPVADANPMALAGVARVCEWPATLKWIARNLASRMETDAAPLNALLSHARPGQGAAILAGIGEAVRGWRKAPKPQSWDRFAAGLASQSHDAMLRDLSVVFGDGRALDAVKAIAMDGKADISARQSALKALIESRPTDLRAICESLLDVRVLNGTAARGLALFDDPQIGAKLADSYRKFAPADRPAVMEILVSRATFAKPLLDQIAAAKIPRTELTAFHARQIRALNAPALTRQLADVWGELRDSPADKQKLIADLKGTLTTVALAKADLAAGRAAFQTLCGACHTMYGNGGKIGPDLTGSGRANLDYLLENIVDPSAVVSADYRMSTVTLKDGRVLLGIVAAQTDRTLTLRLLTEETTLEKKDIASQEASAVSMMPEGQLLALTPDQVRDMVAYLMHPAQVPLPPAQK